MTTDLLTRAADVLPVITAELRADNNAAALAERDDDLKYAVQNDRDDTGIRERIWISCGCNYTRHTQELEECPEHRAMSESLA